MLNSEQCWESVQKRDASRDGEFFFGVMTTGVYCRPSCPSRPPLRKNIQFYESPADAERAGLRPCLRCRPLAALGTDPYTERIREVCRYIETHSTDSLTATAMAEKAGLSLYHFQRSFKAIVGVTPGQYLESARMKQLKSSLRTSKDVTEAVLRSRVWLLEQSLRARRHASRHDAEPVPARRTQRRDHLCDRGFSGGPDDGWCDGSRAVLFAVRREGR